METLKYKVVTSDEQYDEYCQILYDLDFSKKKKTKQMEEEAALLTLLIEKYDEEHSTFTMLNPVELLRSIMKDHNMKSADLANKINVSPVLISEILNYKKEFPKEVIQKIASLFKVYEYAFSRPYQLKISPKQQTVSPAKRKQRQAQAI